MGLTGSTDTLCEFGDGFSSTLFLGSSRVTAEVPTVMAFTERCQPQPTRRAQEVDTYRTLMVDRSHPLSSPSPPNIRIPLYPVTVDS